MAIIDYTDVISLQYAQLSLPAKALIPVLATLADKKTGLIPPHHSKVKTLAAFVGIGYNATRAGLQILHDTNRISLSIVQGHPPKIIYLPIAQFSSRAGSPPRGELAPLLEENQDLLNFAPEPRPDSPDQERQDPCFNSLFKQFKTTTETIPKIVIKEMIREHGVSVVVDVISGMKKKAEAGEKITNPGAYFRTCCSQGWIPTSTNIQEREKRAQGEAREKERQAQKEQAQDSLYRRIEQEQNDPETQKRIKAAQANFWSNINADSEQISGHARPASSF